MKYIRLISPFHKEFITRECYFSCHIEPEKADALLCEWDPHEELLTFPGRKGWYNSEAVFRNMFNNSKWDEIKANKHEQIFIFHAHPNPFFRVPMICYVEPPIKLDNDERMKRCIAIISNCGITWTSNDILLRNSFALHHSVDLYGSEKNWKAYMEKFFSLESLPPNYKGEIRWPWNSVHRFETMSKYKVAICLENVVEPYYITEKFYFAAQTGCIPIYHAHPTVKEQSLIGAKWVDPEDFDFDSSKTIEYALAQSRKTYSQQNFEWLETDQAKSAGLHHVYARLGHILTDNF